MNYILSSASDHRSLRALRDGAADLAAISEGREGSPMARFKRAVSG